MAVTAATSSSVCAILNCRGAHINHGEAWFISFGGLRPDAAVSAETLRAMFGDN